MFSNTSQSFSEQIERLFSEGTIWSWMAIAIIALAVAIIVSTSLRFLSAHLRTFAAKTNSVWDDVIIDLIDELKTWVVFVWAFYLFPRSFPISESSQRILLFVMVLTSIFQIGQWGLHLIKNWRINVLDHKIKKDPSSAAALGLLTTVIQTVFLTILALIGLSNLGVNITALVAGLGVGGIAVALAAQNILGDLLASLSIVLDKPFEVGDAITAGDSKGVVERIGIKTTRIRSFTGEELVVPNKTLVESRIQNFKQMWERQVKHTFGLVYSTSPAKLEQIPIWIKDIIGQQNKLRFDRCHLIGFGAYSIDFELIYFALDRDLKVHMDLQEKILLEIFKKFSQEKVDFAYPTQSLLIEKIPSENQTKLI